MTQIWIVLFQAKIWKYGILSLKIDFSLKILNSLWADGTALDSVDGIIDFVLLRFRTTDGLAIVSSLASPDSSFTQDSSVSLLSSLSRWIDINRKKKHGFFPSNQFNAWSLSENLQTSFWKNF